jgi:hypothetical protein
MRLFKTAAAGPPQPPHVEIWGDLQAQNRFLRRLCGAMGALLFLGLGFSSYALYVGLFRPVAYHVDGDGRAAYVGRLRSHAAPGDAEVRFVAKEYLRRWLAFNSLTIESDLAEAWELMTDELRAEQAAYLERFEKERGEEFVAFIKRQGIQTVLEVDAARTEVYNHENKTFTVKLRGVFRTMPLNRVGEEAAISEKEFESVITLVRCPRTEQTPNGLLVHKVSTRTFVPTPAPLAPEVQPPQEAQP